MIGECNCACMPAHNPFGRFDLFLYASPVSSCIGSPLWIPSKCSPTYTFTGLALTYFVPCIEFMNFVFVCLDSGLFFVFFLFPPPFWFSNVSWSCFSVEESCSLFCDSFVYVTRVAFPELCCFLDSQSANAKLPPPPKKNIYIFNVCTASVPVVLFVPTHY